METPKDKNYIDDTLTSGKHLSPWIDQNTQPQYTPLTDNLTVDVVIIGCGLGGATAGYCLTQAGYTVAIVEDGNICSGETGRTTAQLVTALDDRYYELEKTFGEEKAKLIAQSHKQAIDFVEQTVQKERIACDFQRVNGYLVKHPSDDEESLQKELDAANRAGLNVFEVDHAPDMLQPRRAICFPQQAQFHPVKYVEGLCKAITEKGGKIYTNTRAVEFKDDGITTANGYTIKAKHIVVATNSPVNNKFSLHLMQYAYRTYVIGALIPKGSIAPAQWWDTGDYNANPDIPPYHYVRITPHNDEFDLLISGGEDHLVGNTTEENIKEEDRYTHLETWTKQNFNIGDIVYRWSGQVLEPMDGLAYIGRNPWDSKNVYIITGDSGNGMTHCTIGGMLITDLIQGKENPWEKLYSPSRLKLRELGTMFKEIMKTFIADIKGNPGTEEAQSLSEIQNGTGKLVKLDKEVVGAYRDDNGVLHMVGSECTHLGCKVAWNNDEKSWDCPCHGSRFNYDGKVLNGPAIKDLPYHTDSID